MTDDQTSTEEASSAAPRRTSEMEPSERVRRLKRWFRESLPTVQKWRDEELEPCTAFADGHQWDDKDKAKLEKEGRVAPAFNRIGPILDATTGVELNQQQETVYRQVGVEDQPVAETATALGEWAIDGCDGGRHESRAFRDTLIAGLGWVETRVDDIGDRRVIDEWIDPREMVWDTSAKGFNFQDARFVFRAKEMALETAREMFPGVEDEDLGNNWMMSAEDGVTRDNRRGYRDGRKDDDQPGERVIILEAQWRELEHVGLVVHADGRKEELPVDQLAMAAERMVQMGMPPARVDQAKRWCVYQSFIGREELEGPTKLPTGSDMAYQAMVGKFDRKKGYPYGIVRGMVDPQRYANKWMAQQLHILNTTAKNTLVIEEGATESMDDLRKEWAAVGGVVIMRPGAVVNRRYEVVSGQTMQSVLSELMLFALNSIRDCSGVNLETLGQQQREQAGILEQERKKATVVILAVFFDALSANRKVRGRVRLKLLTSGVIPEQDLAEAVGPEKAQFLPMLMGDKALRFDIVVDEAPTSPNAMDRAWTAMGQTGLVQQMMKDPDRFTPETWAEVIRIMPISSGMKEKLIASFMKPKEPDPMADRMKAAQLGQEEAEVNVKITKAQLQAAQAGQAQIETQREIMTPIEDPNLANQAKIEAARSGSGGPPG